MRLEKLLLLGVLATPCIAWSQNSQNGPAVLIEGYFHSAREIVNEVGYNERICPKFAQHGCKIPDLTLRTGYWNCDIRLNVNVQACKQATMTPSPVSWGVGYEPGPADGIRGQPTGAAYRFFLRDNGLSDGKMPELTELHAMRGLVKAREIELEAMQASTVAPLPSDILHQWAKAGDVAGLRIALDAGADPNRKDRQGWTALMHAVDRGYVEIAGMLIYAGDVDVQAPDGATALLMAAMLEQSEIVALLMRAGADISIRGSRGKTAAEVARLTFGEPDTIRQRGMPREVARLVTMGMTIGETFRDCEACPEMVVVPAGSFMMGSPDLEEDRYDDEGPVRRVEIPYRLAVGKYEVTRGQFAEFVGRTGYKVDRGCFILTGGEWRNSPTHYWRDPGYRQGDDHPVACVSWRHGQDYVKWLSKETGESYRLLSESEWEYTARGGTTTAYHFGSSISPDQANYGCNPEGTVRVGSYPPNRFGLHDVHGNVWEWVEDCWNDDYRDAPSDGRASISGNCDRRMMRGGSWGFIPSALRSANRNWDTFGNRISFYGFRVARTLAP